MTALPVLTACLLLIADARTIPDNFPSELSGYRDEDEWEEYESDLLYQTLGCGLGKSMLDSRCVMKRL